MICRGAKPNMSGAQIVFHSRPQPGHSPQISSDARRVQARKRRLTIDVEIATADGSLRTREGQVQVRAGDAIVTGIGGERWRVSRDRFATRYRAVPPTRSGESGRYESLPIQVLAVPMEVGFEVILRDGTSRLHGVPGDWLVDYGDGSLGIVSPAVFATTYEVHAPGAAPTARPRRGPAFHELILGLLLLGVRLPPPAREDRPRAPSRLQPLIEAISAAHERFDARAIDYGRRYRSGYWAIYLLSACAVLCAVLPLGLGWDSPLHNLHPYSGLWAVAEVAIIGAVTLIYWRGHRGDWHGEWLRARSTAELSAYLPLLAPLLDFGTTDPAPNWYRRLFDSPGELPGAGEIEALCRSHEPLARELLHRAWADGQFIRAYADWTRGILQHQRDYHRRVAVRQHALLSRSHRINAALFGLTALAAVTHLFLHTLWLTLLTTFFPALGASLHGAVAQSEAHRLATNSERLIDQLQTASKRIEVAVAGTSAGDIKALTGAVRSALMLLLEEHQSWHLLVRPHHLPLA